MHRHQPPPVAGQKLHNHITTRGRAAAAAAALASPGSGGSFGVLAGARTGLGACVGRDGSGSGGGDGRRWAVQVALREDAVQVEVKVAGVEVFLVGVPAGGAGAKGEQLACCRACGSTRSAVPPSLYCTDRPSNCTAHGRLCLGTSSPTGQLAGMRLPQACPQPVSATHALCLMSPHVCVFMAARMSQKRMKGGGRSHEPPAVTVRMAPVTRDLRPGSQQHQSYRYRSLGLWVVQPCRTQDLVVPVAHYYPWCQHPAQAATSATGPTRPAPSGTSTCKQCLTLVHIQAVVASQTLRPCTQGHRPARLPCSWPPQTQGPLSRLPLGHQVRQQLLRHHAAQGGPDDAEAAVGPPDGVDKGQRIGRQLRGGLRPRGAAAAAQAARLVDQGLQEGAERRRLDAPNSGPTHIIRLE